MAGIVTLGTFTVEPNSLNRIKRNLKKTAPKATRNIMRRTMRALAKNIRQDARRRVVKKRRRLEKAIVSKLDRESPGQINSSVWIRHGKGARHDGFYWHMVEWGTKTGSPAQPYLTPAFEIGWVGMKKEFRNNFFKQLRKQVQRP